MGRLHACAELRIVVPHEQNSIIKFTTTLASPRNAAKACLSTHSTQRLQAAASTHLGREHPDGLYPKDEVVSDARKRDLFAPPGLPDALPTHGAISRASHLFCPTERGGTRIGDKTTRNEDGGTYVCVVVYVCDGKVKGLP